MTKEMQLRALVLFLALIAAALPATAETVFVTDRFEIGVHENTDIDSVIVAVIPSGTPLTVISRDGEFVEVSTPEGIKGWVDSRYIVNEQPSTVLLTDHDAKLQEAVRSLGAARAEVEVLRQRVTELQRDAATASNTPSGSPGITKTVSLAANEDSAKLEQANRELQTLARENQELKSQVSDLEAAQAEFESSLAQAEATENENPGSSMWRGPVSDEAKSWTPWQWLLFGSILLLAFAAGGYAVDWDSRRRHGGFRI